MCKLWLTRKQKIKILVKCWDVAMRVDSFAQYVKKRRQTMGETMKGLAEKAELSRQGLYKLLKGEMDQAKYATLAKFAHALGVHPVELLYHAFWKSKSLPSSKETKYPGDELRVVEDLTIPDNLVIPAGSVFSKTWRIRNYGLQVWQDRRLQCIDEELVFFRKEQDQLLPMEKIELVPLQREIPIPTVPPGDTVDLSTTFQAPQQGCTTISYWQMIDQEGDACFPGRRGLWCKVRVVESEEVAVTQNGE